MHVQARIANGKAKISKSSPCIQADKSASVHKLSFNFHSKMLVNASIVGVTKCVAATAVF